MEALWVWAEEKKSTGFTLIGTVWHTAYSRDLSRCTDSMRKLRLIYTVGSTVERKVKVCIKAYMDTTSTRINITSLMSTPVPVYGKLLIQ